MEGVDMKPRLAKTRKLRRNIKVRGMSIAVASLLALGFLIPGRSAAANEPPAPVHVGTLSRGGSLFWDGDYVREARYLPLSTLYFFERTTVPDRPGVSDQCATGISPCWLYSFDITEAADEYQLQVALESSSKEDCYALELIDPAGTQRRFPFGCPLVMGGYPTSETFNIEAFIKNPVVGRWQAKVIPADTVDWAFRMRATLEPLHSDEPSLLAPNLTPWLPYEFGFAAPASPRYGTIRGNAGGRSTRSISCTVEENARRCLRFSSGVHNTGDGPLYIDFLQDGSAVQRTYYSDAYSDPTESPDSDYSDNLYEESPAGSGESHPAHGHRHIADFFLFELFKVADASPAPPYDPSGKRLIQLGTGAKHGVCTYEYGIGEWNHFNQDPYRTIKRQVGGDCDDDLSLDKGWGDLYPWDVPDQYVDYASVAEADGSMAPGFYLLRITVDPNGHIVETNDGDNTGYALIKVIEGDALTGDRLVICERGFGSSPWDPHSESTTEPFWWTIAQTSQAPAGDEC